MYCICDQLLTNLLCVLLKMSKNYTHEFVKSKIIIDCCNQSEINIEGAFITELTTWEDGEVLFNVYTLHFINGDNVKKLHCFSQDVKAINIIGLQNLEILDCSYSWNLESIIAKLNSKVRYLDIQGCKVQDINFRNFQQCKEFVFTDNKFRNKQLVLNDAYYFKEQNLSKNNSKVKFYF